MLVLARPGGGCGQPQTEFDVGRAQRSSRFVTPTLVVGRLHTQLAPRMSVQGADGTDDAGRRLTRPLVRGDDAAGGEGGASDKHARVVSSTVAAARPAASSRTIPALGVAFAVLLACGVWGWGALEFFDSAYVRYGGGRLAVLRGGTGIGTTTSAYTVSNFVGLVVSTSRHTRCLPQVCAIHRRCRPDACAIVCEKWRVCRCVREVNGSKAIKTLPPPLRPCRFPARASREKELSPAALSRRPVATRHSSAHRARLNRRAQ